MDDLPPSYSNLGYNSESVPEPSPSKFDEEPRFEGEFQEHTANSSAASQEPEPGPVPLAYTAPNLVFEDIYEACVQHADKHCCYGKRFLNQMKLLDVMNKAVFYYKLESFAEKRESETKSSPYKGEPVDGSANGRPPDPWNMTVLSPDLFEDCHVTTSMPHTEVVCTCPKCNGLGEFRCEPCEGSGHETCSWCSGTGRLLCIKRCENCGGEGVNMCWSCLGAGKTTCSECKGHKKIKYWKVLNVTWKNHVDEYVTDRGYLPIDLIRKAKGVELLKKKDLSLEPVTNAPDATVNTASARMLQSHLSSFPNEMIIRQRQILRAVPLTRVPYQWKEEDGEFYVYGTDRKVYFENYPQKYCCCT